MALTKTISFKENVEDLKLYNWLNTKSSCSCFIKDVLRERLEYEEEQALLKNKKPPY